MRARLDDADSELATARAAMVESYGRWRRALEDVENLWALAAWVSLRERSIVLRFAVSALFVLGLFFCHLFSVGLYGLGLLSYELYRLGLYYASAPDSFLATLRSRKSTLKLPLRSGRHWRTLCLLRSPAPSTISASSSRWPMH